MSTPDPAPEPAEREGRLHLGLRRAGDGDLRTRAGLPASEPCDQLRGRTGFEVRDLVPDRGAQALQSALDGRERGATEGPA